MKLLNPWIKKLCTSLVLWARLYAESSSLEPVQPTIVFRKLNIMKTGKLAAAIRSAEHVKLPN